MLQKSGGARQHTKSDHHQHYHELLRMFSLPEGTQLTQMNSALSDESLLTIEVPYTPVAMEQKQEFEFEAIEIPIQHE